MSKFIITIFSLFIYAAADAQTAFEYFEVDAGTLEDVWGKCAADLDNDGLPDLLANGFRKGGLVWWKNPTWERFSINSDKYFGTDIEACDIDRDGDLDVFAIKKDYVFWQDSIFWYENGNNWQEHLVVFGDVYHDIELVDLDKDNKIDIVARDQDLLNHKDRGSIVYIYQQEDLNSWRKYVIGVMIGEGLKVSDINRDTKPDIVVNNYWLENTGLISDWRLHEYTSVWQHGNVFIDCGDLNNDGYVDIILAPSEEEGEYYRISWFANPGLFPESVWQEFIIDNKVEAVHHYAGVADFDNDGDMDVSSAEMTQGEDPDEVKVYYNSNNGQNWLKQIVSTVGSHTMKILDIDLDGDMDLFGANWNGNKVQLWINKYDPIFHLKNWQRYVVSRSNSPGAVFIAADDVNGDGFSDMVSGDSWYENPGFISGSWTKHLIGEPLYNMAILYDFNGDKIPDILGTDKTSKFYWALNNGHGEFRILNNIQAGDGDFLQGAAIDLSGENITIALSWHIKDKGIQLLTVPADPEKSVWKLEKIHSFSQDEDLTFGDIDNDGSTDLLLGTRWLKKLPLNWELRTIYSTSEKPARNDLVDLNNDGRIDVIVGYEAISRPGKLAWYENPDNSGGSWKEHLIAMPIGPMSLDAADIDFDGDIDVVCGEHNLENPANSRLLLFENKGGYPAKWASHVIYTGDEHHDGAVFADLDNDRDLDIISIGWDHRNVLVYENQSENGSIYFVPDIKLITNDLFVRSTVISPIIRLEVPYMEDVQLGVRNNKGQIMDILFKRSHFSGIVHIIFEKFSGKEGIYFFDLNTANSRIIKKFLYIN